MSSQGTGLGHWTRTGTMAVRLYYGFAMFTSVKLSVDVLTRVLID